MDRVFKHHSRYGGVYVVDDDDGDQPIFRQTRVMPADANVEEKSYRDRFAIALRKSVNVIDSKQHTISRRRDKR